MKVPDRNSPLEETLDYILSPLEDRKSAFYDPKVLDPTPSFTDEERERMTDILELPADHVYHAANVQNLLISLSWASSYLESDSGMTISDTRMLIEKTKPSADIKKDKETEDRFIKDWAKAAGRSEDSSRLILNHKRAITYMRDHPHLTVPVLQTIHSELTRTPQLGGGHTHFLPLSKRGMIRSYSEDALYIDGSSYLPPHPNDRGGDFVENELKRLIDSCEKLPSPIDQSFFLLTRIPYLQAFYDGNRRTSRIAANIPLVNHHLCPVSFIGFSRDAYRTGTVTFYELQDERFMKSAFVKSAVVSAYDYMLHSRLSEASLESKCQNILGKDYVDPDILLARVRERKDKKAGLLPASPGTP